MSNGNLGTYEDEINSYLRNPFWDPESDQELGPNNLLITQVTSKQECNKGTPTWNEFQEVVKASRSVSSRGPSGVP